MKNNCDNKPQNIFLIILENNNFVDVVKQPFFKSLAKQGTLLINSHGVTHPSQPNYFAITAGDTFVKGDEVVTLDVTNLVDLLEKKKISWKAYVEYFPEPCFLGKENECVPLTTSQCAYQTFYVRKHNPFISYLDVQSNPKRCAKIVNATELQRDIANNTVPQFSLYIPNLANDSHNTTLPYADQYLRSTFVPILRNPSFTKDRIFIFTFDESADERDQINHIYTAFWGPNVRRHHEISMYVNHYNILRTIENNFHLGTLGRNDSTAKPVRGFLKKHHCDCSFCTTFKIPEA